jgi:hypothetical protein
VPSYVGYVVLGLGLAIIALALQRANELFLVSVRDGKTMLVRGRIPPALLAEIDDVVSRARVRHASVRAVKSDARPRLIASGVDAATEQRLRNVLGTFPMQRLKSAPGASRKNLGQWLGSVSLSWWLSQPRR